VIAPPPLLIPAMSCAHTFSGPVLHLSGPYLAMQSFTVLQLHQGKQRFPYLDRIASFTFCAKLGLEHRGSRVPYFSPASRGVDQLRPHRHQSSRVAAPPGSAHSDCDADRVQRLRIHAPNRATCWHRCDPLALGRFDPPLTAGWPPTPRAPLCGSRPAPSRVSSHFDNTRAAVNAWKNPQYLPASSATVLRPVFLPPNPKCSTDSSGSQIPLPPSDDPIGPYIQGSSPGQLPSTSAITSFASRCAGPRDFVRFKGLLHSAGRLLCLFNGRSPIL